MLTSPRTLLYDGGADARQEVRGERREENTAAPPLPSAPRL